MPQHGNRLGALGKWPPSNLWQWSCVYFATAWSVWSFWRHRSRHPNQKVTCHFRLFWNADEVVEDLCDPTVEQAEEKEIPNGCESGWGCTRLMWPICESGGRRENSQRLWQRMRSQVIFCPNGGSGGRGEDSQRLWRQKRNYTSIYDPAVEQAEEQEAPNGYEGGWGHIEFPLWEGKFFGQTWVGQIHQPCTGLEETTLTKTPVLWSRKVQALMTRSKSYTYASFRSCGRANDSR